MKPLYKIIISIVLFAVPGMALASMSNPADLDDTIPAAPRCDKYYYTKWFDDCPNYVKVGNRKAEKVIVSNLLKTETK
jgi:hypothetical protein